MKSQYLQLSSIISDFRHLAGATSISEETPDVGSSIDTSARRSANFVGTAGIIESRILGCGRSGTVKGEQSEKEQTTDALGRSIDSMSSIFSSKMILFGSLVSIPAHKASSILETEAFIGIGARNIGCSSSRSVGG